MKKLLSILLALVLLAGLCVPSLAVSEPEIMDEEPVIDEEAMTGDGPVIDEPEPDGEAGPSDIWAAVTALESSVSAYAPEDYEALLPQVEQIILSSPSYEAGTMEYEDGILFWRSDGCLNGYSAESRALNNGFGAEEETSPAALALYDESMALIEDGLESAPAPDGASGTGDDVAVFRPYAGYAGDYDSVSFKSIGEMLVFFTGGQCHVCEAQQADIDALADALETCCVVLVNTHGKAGYICLTTGSGITQEDQEDRHAWNSGTSKQANNRSVWQVDGTAISNHMERNAPQSFVWLGNCEGMKNDRTCAPLRNRGVAAVLGFSESVTTVGDAAFAMAFWYNMGNRRCTAAQAFDYMREACGCDWDPLYPNYTAEQASRYGVAFPVLVSDRDDYPGAGHVNAVFDPQCTWRLPESKKDLLPDHTNTSLEIRVNTSAGDTVAKVNTTEAYKSVTCTEGALPPGMSWNWKDGRLHFTGTPTKPGYYKAYFEIITTGGKRFTHGLYIMVTAAKVKESSQFVTFTAPETGGYLLQAGEQYYASLDFPGDDSTYSMEILEGFLPLTLKVGFSDGNRGYIRSATASTQPGNYLATQPGTYKVTLEIISYSGSVYRHTVSITVWPGKTSVMDPIKFNAVQFEELSQVIKDSTNYQGFTLLNGSLPDGVYLANSALRPFGLYGTPTESGDFSATYLVTDYNTVYRFTFNVHVAKGTPQTLSAVSIDLPAPRAGSPIPCPTNGQPAAGSHFTIGDQFWSTGFSTSGKITSGTFENGRTYYYYAELYPDPGYAFAGTVGRVSADELKVTACGEDAYSLAKNAAGRVIVYIPVKAAGPAYNATASIVLGGFTEPAAGAPVQSKAVAASTDYTISAQKWSSTPLGIWATPDTTFQPGKTYYWICDVKLNNGYGFPEDYRGSLFLNGKMITPQSSTDYVDAMLNETPVCYWSVKDDTMSITISYKVGGEAGTPAVKLSADGKSAQATNFTGLYARVALVLDNNGVSGLYVTQATINSDGSVVIPAFMVPGLKVRAINIALVPTLADIQKPNPTVRATDFKNLS